MKLTPQLAIVGAGAAVAIIGALYYIAKREGAAVVDAAGGIISGNNALTQAQTNAAGEKTTAYEGAGVAGTIGAAANTASGGVFASFGEWLGGGLYDLVNVRTGSSKGEVLPGVLSAPAQGQPIVTATSDSWPIFQL